MTLPTAIFPDDYVPSDNPKKDFPAEKTLGAIGQARSETRKRKQKWLYIKQGAEQAYGQAITTGDMARSFYRRHLARADAPVECGHSEYAVWAGEGEPDRPAFEPELPELPPLVLVGGLAEVPKPDVNVYAGFPEAGSPFLPGTDRLMPPEKEIPIFARSGLERAVDDEIEKRKTEGTWRPHDSAETRVVRGDFCNICGMPKGAHPTRSNCRGGESIRPHDSAATVEDGAASTNELRSDPFGAAGREAWKGKTFDGLPTEWTPHRRNELGLDLWKIANKLAALKVPEHRKSDIFGAIDRLRRLSNDLHAEASRLELDKVREALDAKQNADAKAAQR